MAAADWPSHYPFVTRQSYNGAQERTIILMVGDEGRVVKLSPDNKWAHMSVPRRQVSGYVPTRCIKIGTTRRFGDTQVQFGFSTETPRISLPEGTLDGGVFGSTVATLLQSWKDNPEEMAKVDCMPYFLRNQLLPPNIVPYLAQMVEDGVRSAGVLDVLNQTDFSIPW